VSRPFRSRHAHVSDRPLSPPVRDKATDAHTLHRLRATTNGDRTVLLRGGTIVSVDPTIGDLHGDLLIKGRTIAEVGPDLGRAAEDEACVVIDATGTIIIPGFVDSHVHAWAGQLRGLAPAIDFATYLNLTHRSLAPQYRPQDIYAGTLMTALQALDAGVTTIIDNSHNSRTPEHSEAAVEAVLDARIRAVHAAGAAMSGPSDDQLPEDVLRLRDQYSDSEGQLITFRLFEAAPTRRLWTFAQRHELWMSHELGPTLATDLAELQDAGLLTERHTFNHCYGLAESAWKLVADSGAQINLAPRSDANFGLGPAHPPVDHALGHGIRPGLSMDNEISYALDMFVEMQTLLTGHRSRSFEAALTGQASAQLTVAEVLEFATLGGAANAGLDHRIGSLAPGKDADLVMVSTTDFNTTPANTAHATLVGFANRSNVDTVFIGGEVRKWRGHLVGADLGLVRAMAERSRDDLLTGAGLRPDAFAPQGVIPKDPG
jgi:cytosine/adenosine deaminase-related metal-dependent hydrolase